MTQHELPSSFHDDRSRWLAVQHRIKAADDVFFYCVRTTGVFCRPSCKARLARRSNVEFFDTAIQAKAAGFRPCKRCRPELAVYAPDEDLVDRVQALIDHLPANAPPPSLDDMAKGVGLTKHHFHRTFKRVTGVTPKAYVTAKRSLWRGSALESSDGSLSSATEQSTPRSFNDLDASPRVEDLFDELIEQSNLLPPISVDKLAEPLGVLADTDTAYTELQGPLFYNTTQTRVGTLLVAMRAGEICTIELQSTVEDLTTGLLLSSNGDATDLSHMDQASGNEAALLSAYTSVVAKAVEEPQGTMLDLPLSQSLRQVFENQQDYLLAS